MQAAGGDEIRVAQGTYKPDAFALSDRPSLGRYETFQLVTGVAIRGGYAGIRATNPNERNIRLHKTILTGDLNGDDQPNFVKNTDNCLHVVTGSQTDATAVLDGFIVTAGNANLYDSPHGAGAGMVTLNGAPTIINCTFTGNFSGHDDGGGAGGAMFNGNSQPTIENCTFTGNGAIALDGGEGLGGAMFNDYSEVTLRHCSFIGNTSGRDGGAVYNYGGSMHATNCLFSGNLAREGGSGSYGGGMYIYECDVTLANSTFAQNAARADYGSGGGGLYILRPGNLLVVRNCILWGNTDEGGMDESAQIDGSDTDITYSCVQGWNGGAANGNTDQDPCFASGGYWLSSVPPGIDSDNVWINGDYHLKSRGGRYDPAMEAWVVDEVTSPCIDTGDLDAPIGLEPFPSGGRLNMGVYGGTAHASKSYFGALPCQTIVAGDINGDCLVSLTDMAILSRHWLVDLRR